MKGDAEVDDMVSKSFGVLKETEEIAAITDRQFLMRLDEDNFLDCSDYLTEDNTGVFIADRPSKCCETSLHGRRGFYADRCLLCYEKANCKRRAF